MSKERISDDGTDACKLCFYRKNAERTAGFCAACADGQGLHDLRLGRGYAACRKCRDVHGRPSLTGSGVGVTSSVLNGIGHKDEYVARKFAEAAAEKFVCTAVCSCGIHIDDITPAQLQEVSTVCDKLLKQVIWDA